MNSDKTIECEDCTKCNNTNCIVFQPVIPGKKCITCRNSIKIFWSPEHIQCMKTNAVMNKEDEEEDCSFYVVKKWYHFNNNFIYFKNILKHIKFNRQVRKAMKMPRCYSCEHERGCFCFRHDTVVSHTNSACNEYKRYEGAP